MKKKPFGIVTADVIKDPALSLRAKGLYSLLATFARQDRTCYPSINKLSEFAGVSRRTVERTLNELEEHGYVKREGSIFTLQ